MARTLDPSSASLLFARVEELTSRIDRMEMTFLAKMDSMEAFLRGKMKRVEEQWHMSIYGSALGVLGLPDELVTEPGTIFSYLGATDLCKASLVSKEWRRLALDDLLWRRLLQLDNGKAIRINDQLNWRQIFIDTRTEFGMRRVLGRNFTGVSDFIRFFGKNALDGVEVPPLPRGIFECLHRECPISPGRKILETHILFLQPNMLNLMPSSILDWHRVMNYRAHRSEFREGRFKRAVRDGVWSREPFATKTIDHAKWVLMPMFMLSGTAGLTYHEQIEILRDSFKDYRSVCALTVVTGIMLHYLQTGEKVFGEGDRIGENDELPYVRVEDQSLGSETADRIIIGSFAQHGLYVLRTWPQDGRYPDLGIIAEWNFM